MTTITNDVFGFSVDVPVEWEATEGDPSLGELLLAAQADIGVPRVLIDLSFASSLGSVADLAQQALDRLQAIIPEVEVADEGPVTLEDGTEAYDYTIDFPSDTLSLRGKFLVIPRGSHIFQVFAETLEIDFETREPDLTRLARSFRLRPQVPFGVPKEQALNLFDFTPARFDPHVIEDIVSAKYATQVYGGLVRLDRDLNVVPDLAESIDVSPDGTVYTFRLRSGVQFHSGKPVTAQDVKYSVERAAAQSTASPVTPLYLNDIEGVLEKYTGAAEDVSGVEVIDDRTVRIRITQPVPFFLAKMTHPTGFVVNQENVESGDFWFLEPDGTGPFKVKGWNPGVVMALEAFQEYHLGAPKLPYVLVWNFGGPSLVMFEAGDMDVVEIAGDDAVAAQDPASTLFDRLQAVPQLGIFYVGFNANESPFDDPRARRAFALAIDKDLLIQEITSDTVSRPAGSSPRAWRGSTPV